LWKFLELLTTEVFGASDCASIPCPISETTNIVLSTTLPSAKVDPSNQYPAQLWPKSPITIFQQHAYKTLALAFAVTVSL
jgi:hypothetical protein